jgi:hypothetical protein
MDQNLRTHLYDVISDVPSKCQSTRHEHISHDYRLLDHSISFNRDPYITKTRPN